MQRPARLIRSLITAGVLLAVATSVVACGGGGGGTASTPPASSVAATTVPAAGTAATSEAAATAAASVATGGGGAAGLACDLVMASEASAAIGGGTFTTESLPGDPSYCTYKGSGGAIAALTSRGQKDAKLGYDVWASASDSVKVPGIGDGAVWVPSVATLLILKGDTVVGITAGSGSDDEAKRLEWSKALGTIAVARM